MNGMSEEMLLGTQILITPLNLANDSVFAIIVRLHCWAMLEVLWLKLLKILGQWQPAQ